jgi:ATP sulfurylase
MKKIKILCTLGPASMSAKVIKRMDDLGVDLFRINLSHTQQADIEKAILTIKAATNKPICLDTEGAQIRTGFMANKKVTFKENSIVKIHKDEAIGDSSNIFLKPSSILDQLEPGDLISIDFDNVLLKVKRKTNDFLEAVVICAGSVGSNKAVKLDRDVKMACLSEKDKFAIQIGSQHGIKHIALSFANKKDDVLLLRKLAGIDTQIISKIESKQGLNNLEDIVSVSDAILIDRGDLSKEEPLEMIPFLQKTITRVAKANHVPVYVATNLLESMVSKIVPTRAELNDCINTLLDGADGLVLAAETAIGKYPVECVRMVNRLIKAYSMLSSRKLGMEMLGERPAGSLTLIEPHGGFLVERFNSSKTEKELRDLKKLVVDETVLVDAEQIAIGTYSPLEGFMTRKEINAVLDQYRLPQGVVWTLPVVLQLPQKKARRFKKGETIVLVSEKDSLAYALLHLEDIYCFDFCDIARRWYGTLDTEHPGVKMLKEKGNYFIGGKIELLMRLDTKFKEFTLTPRQTRHIFEKKGWNTVVGFHTRNVIHKAHEYLQLAALKKMGIDGLFIHPIIGPKKKFDFAPDIILKSYMLMLQRYYPKNRVLLGAFMTFSRYAGPREAVFTAICRKNFGCTHFIVGRDHTGVGKFYPADGARKLFEKLGDIGISPIFFEEVYYCRKCRRYVQQCGHKHFHSLKISGTQARNMLLNGKRPPEWFMRREIAKLVLAEMQNGSKVFLT